MTTPEQYVRDAADIVALKDAARVLEDRLWPGHKNRAKFWRLVIAKILRKLADDIRKGRA